MDSQNSQYSVLENSPSVLNHLAHTLGLSEDLSFHEVYSLSDPDLLSPIPRPIFALLCIIPLTDEWKASRQDEDAVMSEYKGSGPNEPVVWFKQTIPHTCGSIGVLHCVCNGRAEGHIKPGSELALLLDQSIPLRWDERAKVLEKSEALFHAHEAAASLASSKRLALGPHERVGQHFVAFVKGRDGRLYELEGTRKGPLDCGALEESEDVLSEKAIELGVGRLMKLMGQDLRFSCVALAASAMNNSRGP